ncbi:MAG: diguanylate cyclase [Rhodobacteraceae bacterium]|nr:diguanylate cyclase [Paracoccaceae bacterium]
MQGTIVIIDAISTNRIMLKVQLSSAWYHVVQADGLTGLADLLRRTRPDLIISAMDLPDGTALDLHALVAGDTGLAATPIIAIAPQNDHAARLKALAAGIDEVLVQPLDDMLLQARIRSLIRTRSLIDDLRLQGGPRVPDLVPGLPTGLAEAAAGFTMPARVTAPMVPVAPGNIAIVTDNPATNAVWRARLKGLTPHHLQGHQFANAQTVMAAPEPDVIVLELPQSHEGAGLRLLADLLARRATRHAAIICVPNSASPALAAEALDRGAQDVLQNGFCGPELILRINTQLHLKARMDQMRSNMRDGLRAALRDPMTGLFNRRYAMPWLSRTARCSSDQGHSFAVMLADLDHFKQINDQFGHPAGDIVLVETARRLKAASSSDDMVARIGGEEFMIVLPQAGQNAAMLAADRLCRTINATPFSVPGISQPITVTISIGIAVSPPPASPLDPSIGEFGDHISDLLITQADRALYQAKGAGRNQFTLIRPAA